MSDLRAIRLHDPGFYLIVAQTGRSCPPAYVALHLPSDASPEELAAALRAAAENVEACARETRAYCATLAGALT